MSRLLIFFGVYEQEKSYAGTTLSRLLDILAQHDVHVAVQDDASASQVGQRLVDEFRSRVPIRLIRLERSLGYHGTYERAVSFLDRAVGWGEDYDYLIRVDADLHFCTPKLNEVLASPQLPKRGMVGPTIDMRCRDYLLFLVDQLPCGLMRSLNDGIMSHSWVLRRKRPVWWHDIGRRSLLHGFRGKMVPGVLQIIAWRSIKAMAERGWLSRSRASTGLVFQDDLIITAMVKALGDPVIEISDVVKDFKYELFLHNSSTASDILRSGYDLIHPLKDNDWAHALRKTLSQQPCRPSSPG
jgi:hypothetical protein